MSFLVDTCAISELLRPKPSPLVREWFDAAPAETLHVSVLSLGELRKGVEMLTHGRRRARIVAWLETRLPAWFEDRVLAIDADVADEWGRLMARVERPVPAVDSLIAATALRHRLSVVTRNVRDFAGTGVEIVDPWEA